MLSNMFLTSQGTELESLEIKHFVLVHGGSFGAWCWYKTTTLLKETGYQVNAIDSIGSGAHYFDFNNISTFSEYVKPLINFIENLLDGSHLGWPRYWRRLCLLRNGVASIKSIKGDFHCCSNVEKWAEHTRHVLNAECNLVGDPHEWWMDSGVTRHVCDNKELFSLFPLAQVEEVIYMGNKPLGSKWIFKRKIKVDGTIDKYKARLVEKGFKQKEGIDYFDTYSPVMRITSIRMLIALAAVYGLEIHQMDVKTTLLDGELEEEIYMEQPEGFVIPEKENKVYKLVKSLYGLKYPTVLKGYSDANWITGSNEVKSTSGYVFTIGGGAVSWKSSKQTYIACSIMELEFITLDKASEEAEWIWNFFEDIPYWPKPVAPLKDNVSDPLTKGLSREGVERISKGMDLRPRTSHHGGNST
ncbi:hypothetical protein FXO38_00338 [Capsicum annuum]|nr:hypothetical protein FXO37_16034 [Capsicum annuum]KAF3684361.1 hypothetical protein FXO38_00338 [Capsicum annuum]